MRHSELVHIMNLGLGSGFKNELLGYKKGTVRAIIGKSTALFE